MAKKRTVVELQASYDDLLRDYKRYVRDFDKLLVYNATIHDKIAISISELRRLSVSESILEQSGMVELANKPSYSKILGEK